MARLLFSEKPDPAIHYLTEKITGFFLFGIIPFLLFVCLIGILPSEAGFTSGVSGRYWYLLVIFLAIVTVLTFIGSKKKITQERYPQLRIKVWSLKYSIISVSGWILYILGYEFFFRGIFLFICFREFGFWAALLINVFLYALVHLDQGVFMSLGSVPLGVILCLLSLLTGSFLFAFLIHSWMALSNEIFSIYHNPSLSFRLKQKGP
jgi:membrane protease YdiL (CAAX protease family)